jgi:dipeptidyl aminopeptidase/acylaminoacyl peptidase
MKYLYLLICGTMLAVSSYAQPKEKVKATDLTKIQQVGTIAISPSGKQAVYVLNTTEGVPDSKFEYEYRSHLYLVDLENKTEPRPLTYGSESSSQPAWSPDGSKIAFVRKARDKNQIFVLPMRGGEAWQLTSLAYGAGSPRWSPDGKTILFATSLSMSEMMKDSIINPRKELPAWSLEKPGFADNSFVKVPQEVKPDPDGSLAEIRAFLQKDAEDKKAKVINRLNFQAESTTQPELSFGHLYTIEVRQNATPRPLTRGYYNYGQAEWTPKGEIVLITQGDSLQHPDRSLRNRVVRINADGSGWFTLLTDPERTFSQPGFSPDGKYLAFITSLAPIRSGILDQGHVGVLNMADLKKPILTDFDRSAGNLTWGTDSKALYFSASSNGGAPAYRIGIPSGKLERLTDYVFGITDFAVSGQEVLYAKTEVANPSELYRADLSFKKEEQLSHHNTEWIKNRALSYPEKHTLKNSAGQNIDYWIMKPTFLEVGKKYPLLLEMHGGPTAMWGPGEASMWHEFQFFCSQGYGIVYANPRGSGGYGVDFMKANYRDWGTGPAEDVLAAADVAAKEAWVDTARQVITGGSYAGYLTAWIVGHDDRFKVAFAQRGVYELTTFMGEGNAWRLVPGYFGGYPWEEEAAASMRANSPQSFVQNIHTPLLIKHGENDLRTGVIQSELLYKSLKILGRDVEYVRMPGATHELSRSGNPRQRIDRILRIYEFFERYVGKE